MTDLFLLALWCWVATVLAHAVYRASIEQAGPTDGCGDALIASFAAVSVSAAASAVSFGRVAAAMETLRLDTLAAWLNVRDQTSDEAWIDAAFLTIRRYGYGPKARVIVRACLREALLAGLR